MSADAGLNHGKAKWKKKIIDWGSCKILIPSVLT